MMLSKKPHTTASGFTLMEVLLTIAIIAVLAALITPIYIQVVDGARRTKCAHNLNYIGSAILAYELEHGRLPGPLSSADTLEDYLASAGYIIEDDAWVCPSVKEERIPKKGSQIAHTSSYALNNSSNSSPAYFFGETTSKSKPLPLSLINSENPSGVWLIRDGDFHQSTFSFDPDNSPGLDEYKPPHAKGRNYFFADGHIEHLKIGNFPSEEAVE